jgi:hypothetical protein
MWTGAKKAIEEGQKNVAFLRTNIEIIDRFFAEDELPYLYLDLFSGNADYTQFSQSALLYGYVDIRQ